MVSPLAEKNMLVQSFPIIKKASCINVHVRPLAAPFILQIIHNALKEDVPRVEFHINPHHGKNLMNIQ